MKLKDLLLNNTDSLQFNSFGDCVKDVLEPLKDDLLSCDEFSECDEIIFMDKPTREMDDNIMLAQTIKIGDETKFKGKIYLYSISLTPEMYDPNMLLEPVKDGAAIGPTIYNPTDFTPRKHILLTWNPEIKQDILNIDTEQEQKQIIRKLLDDVLNNPEEYRVKGERGVLVRGIFEIDNNELSNRHKNAMKNTFAELIESDAAKLLKKEIEILDDLNEYLRMLAEMDNINVHRKVVLLEGCINKVKTDIKQWLKENKPGA